MSKIILYHGGNLKEGIKSAYSHSSKRWEYGPGLYLTSHYDTAAKYAKGSRKLYKVTVEKGTNINDVKLDFDSAVEFVNKNAVGSKRRDIINRFEKYETDGLFPAYIMNNVLINENAIKPSKSNDLREFFVENGIDYNIETNAFGWNQLLMVVFNFDKVTNIEESGDGYEDLPQDFIESKFDNKYDNTIRKFNESEKVNNE